METRRIDMIAAGIILLIFVVTYFAFIKESRAKVASLRETETMLQEHLDSSGDMSSALNGIKEEIEAIHRNLEKFDKRLPKEKRIYDFLVEIDKLGRDNRVELQSISPGKLETGSLYSKVPIRISGNAGFRDFYTFLYRLEKMPRITKIEGLKVNNLPEGGRTNIEMNLAVFVSGK